MALRFPKYTGILLVKKFLQWNGLTELNLQMKVAWTRPIYIGKNLLTWWVAVCKLQYSLYLPWFSSDIFLFFCFVGTILLFDADAGGGVFPCWSSSRQPCCYWGWSSCILWLWNDGRYSTSLPCWTYKSGKQWGTIDWLYITKFLLKFINTNFIHS